MLESSHQEYLNQILEYNFDYGYEIQARQEEVKKEISTCKEDLRQLRRVINRVPYFEIFLTELVEKQEISQVQKQAIISYIQIGVDKKKTTTYYFKPNRDYERQKRVLPSRESNIWDKIAEICKEIDLIEKDNLASAELTNAYERTEQELDNNLKLQALLEGELEMEQKKIAQAFKAEDGLTIEKLNVLCRNTKKAELLIIDTYEQINFDLATVIKMRAKQSVEKGNQLVVMSFEEFDALMQSGQEVEGLTKLSFLHHLTHEFGYVGKIPHYINHLPHLREIVLRGCGTSSRVKNEILLYEAKVSDAPYEAKPSIQGVNQLVIQQKEENGEILTKVSWRKIDPETNRSVGHKIAGIKNIPRILEEQLSDEQLSALERIPQMPLLKHSHRHCTALKNTFFDKKKPISPEELAEVKKVVHRARTQPTLIGEGFLSEVLDGMTEAQKARVSVKAYIGGYHVYQGRVIPIQGHSYDNQPKAVRVGPSPKI